MSSEGVARSGAVVLFACLVALGYICQAWAFRSAQPVAEAGLARLVSIAAHPVFILGLALSFGSTLARLAMFERLGVTQTVFAQELSVLLMVGLSLSVFREALTAWQMVGGVLILGGVFLVAR